MSVILDPKALVGTSMDRVKIGVIGCGLWGVCHIEAYLGLPHAELVAVADSEPGRAEQVANTFNIPQWFNNYEDLCKLTDLDAVSIVTPESEHLKPVEAAAKSGKHILVEKPISRSVSEADEMIATAHESNVFLMPGHILRFEPRYVMIQEKLVNHDIGNVVTMRTRRNRTKGNFKQYGRVHPLFVTGVHDIDIMLWYARSPVKKVRGYQRNIQGSETPDVVWGILEFESGCIGILETTWLTPDQAGIFSNDALEVVTDNGIAMLDLVPDGLSFWLGNGFSVPDILGAPRVRGRVMGSLATELSYFATCVMRKERPVVVTAEEARDGILIASALLESAERQEEVIPGFRHR